MDQSHQRRFYSEAADGSVGKQAGNSLSLVAVGPSGRGQFLLVAYIIKYAFNFENGNSIVDYMHQQVGLKN